MRAQWANRLATVFYLGYFPFASGSIASVAGAGIALVCKDHIWIYGFSLTVIMIIGFWASGPAEQIAQEKDPSAIVIDEVAGALIAFFLLPMTWPVMISAFFLFRAFDMFKIYPANKFEIVDGAVGVMMDDIVAGIYTNIIMHAAIYLQALTVHP